MSDNTVLDTVVLRTIRGLGYTRLNDEEKSLIENLRWTRHAGRTEVYLVAKEQRRKRPWVEHADSAKSR